MKTVERLEIIVEKDEECWQDIRNVIVEVAVKELLQNGLEKIRKFIILVREKT